MVKNIEKKGHKEAIVYIIPALPNILAVKKIAKLGLIRLKKNTSFLRATQNIIMNKIKFQNKLWYL